MSKPKKEYEFVCDFCNKSFSSKEECKKHEEKCKNNKLKGIGGWLLFWVISSCLGLFFEILFLIFLPFISQQIGLADKLTSIDIIELIVGIILTSISLIFIFLKKKFASKIVIGTIILSAAISLVSYNKISIMQAIYNLVVAILWLFYFLKSNRVKNTFVK